MTAEAPPSTGPDRAAPRGAATLLSLAVVLVALAPPETRGEGAVATALAIAGALALAGLAGRWRGTTVVALAVLGAAAWPLALAAAAPGPAIPRIALVGAALAAGGAAAGVSRELRSGSPLPWAIGLAGAVPAVLGAWQAVAGLRRTSASLDRSAWEVLQGGEVFARLDAGRAFAAFPTPAALGGWIAMTLPATVALTFACRGRRRLVAGALAVAQAIGLLATRSVTAAGALLAALLIASVAGSRPSRRRVLAAALVVAAVLAAAVVSRGAEILSGDPSTPLAQRAANVRTGLAMIGSDPWAGVGAGGYGEAYPAFRRPGDNESRYAHDLPVQVVAEVGVPAGVPAAIAFYVLFLLPGLRRRTDDDAVSRGIAVGLAAFAVHNLADFTAFLPSFAIGAAILRGAIAGPPPHGATPHVRSPIRAVAAVAACLALGVLAVEGLAADARWRSRWLAMQGETDAALGAARSGARLAPWSPDGWERLAEASALAGAVHEGVGAADRAVAASPVRPSARRLRGALRVAAGDLPGGLADLTFAAERNPADPTYAAERDAVGARLDAGPTGGEP